MRDPEDAAEKKVADDTATFTFDAVVAERHYFSAPLLWAAQHFATSAEQIEQTAAGPDNNEHLACVLGAIVQAFAFVEASINEVFQDASDGSGDYCTLPPHVRDLMNEWWSLSNEGMGPAVNKYQMLLLFADCPRLDTNTDPYQSATLLAILRNHLVHFRPETIARDGEGEKMRQRLKGRFDDNALMKGRPNGWWPSHALGAGCAWWSYRAAKALVDEAFDRVGIVPVYRSVSVGWP